MAILLAGASPWEPGRVGAARPVVTGSGSSAYGTASEASLGGGVEDSPDRSLGEAARYVAVRRVQDAYADIVTRRAWAELATVFLPDAVVEIDTRGGATTRLTGPAALGEFIDHAIARFDFFEFVVLNAVVAIGDGGDTATGRVYICELRHDAASGRFTVAYGVYHDEYREIAGHWWIAGRRYHSLARTATTGDAALEVFGFPHHLVPDLSATSGGAR